MATLSEMVAERKSSAPNLSNLVAQRRSEETGLALGEDYPEFDLPLEPKFRQLKTAFGLMTTFSPERQVQVLQANYPELKYEQMRDGSVLVDGTAYGGNVGYLNKPGVSGRDVTQFAGQAGLFALAGRAGRAGAGFMSNMARVGVASAATQAGIDLANQATYQTPRVGDIDTTDVAVAGAGGALFEPLAAFAGRFLPQWKRTRQVTDQARAEFKRAAQRAGQDPAGVTDDVIRRYMESAERATPDEAAAGGQRGEFGIRQTQGQRTGNLEQLGTEDTLRNTQISPKAQQRMREFQDLQNQDIEQAVGGRQRALGGAQQETPPQAAQAAGEGVRERGEQLWREVGQAYESVGEAAVEREGLTGILDSMRKTFTPTDFVRDPVIAPSTAKIVGDYAKQRKVLARHGDRLKPVHIDTLEALRRRMLAFEKSAGNPNDARQVRQLIRAYDEGVDNAFDAALVQGDDQALEALKTARSLRRRYAELFQRQDTTTRGGQRVKDTAGDFVERMMAREPSAEELARTLYGVSKIGGKKGSLELARKFKGILGERSEEWAAVRQGAFLHIFRPDAKGAYSGRMILNRLKESRIYGDSFMRELFSPQERGQMVRLANAIKRVQPVLENPPRTAYKATDIVMQTLRRLLPSLGFAAGGPAGAVAGAGAASSLGWRSYLQAVRATSEARRAPIVVGAGVPGALAGREQLSGRTPEGAIAQRQ